jgi:hypothetical protein
MSLKVYVAGRISRQEEMKMIFAALRQVGIEITRDWIAMSEQLKHTAISNEAEATTFRNDLCDP